MGISKYLPSAQLATLAVAIGLSGVLVLGAQYVTGKPAGSAALQAAGDGQSADSWAKELEEIQNQATFAAVPDAPSPESVSNLLAAAQSDNLTSTVARSLFVSLSEAKAQGLGGDIPTQEQLIAQASALASDSRPGPTYTLSDLKQVNPSTEALHEYGNAVLNAFVHHPEASQPATFAAVAAFVDTNDTAKLAGLTGIGGEYRALARELARLAVPRTLGPLHLQILNNLALIGATYKDLAQMSADPMRGLVALQMHQSISDETARVFITLARQFQASGILFTTDEPGGAWSGFLST